MPRLKWTSKVPIRNRIRNRTTSLSKTKTSSANIDYTAMGNMSTCQVPKYIQREIYNEYIGTSTEHDKYIFTQTHKLSLVSHKHGLLKLYTERYHSYVPDTEGLQHRRQRKAVQNTSEYHQPSHRACSATDWKQYTTYNSQVTDIILH